MKTSQVIQNSLRLWLKFSNANAFEQATRQPVIVQEEKLLAIIRRNRYTEYGTEHQFAKIRSALSKWDFRNELRHDPDIALALLPVMNERIRELEARLTRDRPADPAV